jgi:hypothetical protein
MVLFFGLLHMQPTFFFAIILPPPSSGAKIFTGPDRPGAGRAPDADKSLIVQRVVGYFVRIDVLPDRCRFPVQQRIIFDDLVVVVPFYYMVILAVR